jgi:hypothetical protein
MADADYVRINYLRWAEYRQRSSAIDGAGVCVQPLKKFCQHGHLYVSYIRNYKGNCKVAIVYSLKKCGGMEA